MALTLVVTYVILSYVFIGVVIRVNSPIQGEPSFMRKHREDMACTGFAIAPMTIAMMLFLVVMKCIDYLIYRFVIGNPRPLNLGPTVRFWEHE